MEIRFITGNKKKFEEAQQILAGWNLLHVDMDLEEIQGNRHEVIEAKARLAFKLLQCPLIVEDVSLCCPCLNDLPGPFIKDFLRRLGDQGFYELVHKYEDHTARCICMAAFVKTEGDPQIFEGIINGTIVTPRGDVHHGKYSWNAIFRPDGFDKTFGEMPLTQHSEFSHRKIALSKLRKHLEQREKTHVCTRSDDTRVL